MSLKCSMCDSKEIIGFTAGTDTEFTRYLYKTEVHILTWEARCKEHLGKAKLKEK